MIADSDPRDIIKQINEIRKSADADDGSET